LGGFLVLYKSEWVARKGPIRVKASFPVKKHLLVLNSARAAYRTRVQKKRQGACFFKVQFVSFASSISPLDAQATLENRECPGPNPAAKLPKPVDSNFDGLARLLELCM